MQTWTWKVTAFFSEYELCKPEQHMNEESESSNSMNDKFDGIGTGCCCMKGKIKCECRCSWICVLCALLTTKCSKYHIHQNLLQEKKNPVVHHSCIAPPQLYHLSSISVSSVKKFVTCTKGTLMEFSIYTLRCYFHFSHIYKLKLLQT